MDGLNASVSAGWYTFTNLGPLTTTYTPAPSCTASNRVGLGYVNPTGGNVYIAYALQCTSDFDYFTGCTPTTTSAVSTPTFTATSYEDYEEYEDSLIEWKGFGAYYSPGLHCPSGWTTIGMAARDSGSSITSSGIMVPTASATATTKYSTDDMYYYMFNYEDPASVLKGILEPKQTMALCCPSAMTADNNGACYSVVKDYKPSVGCQAGTGYNYEYSEVPYTYSDPSASTIETGYRDVPTTTIYTTDTFSTTFDHSEQTYYTALSYAPMITLLHHESDLKSARASSTLAATPATTAATTSNAAGKIGPRAPVWGGAGSLLGISAVGMALGAAVIFPW